jgi:hypothetical protein
MRNLNVHYFNDNKTLATYLAELCSFFDMDKNTVEVRDDMAILEGKNSVMVFTKNEDILLELSENCNCIILHCVPDLKIISKIMDNNAHFLFKPITNTRKKHGR